MHRNNQFGANPVDHRHQIRQLDRQISARQRKQNIGVLKERYLRIGERIADITHMGAFDAVELKPVHAILPRHRMFWMMIPLCRFDGRDLNAPDRR